MIFYRNMQMHLVRYKIVAVCAENVCPELGRKFEEEYVTV